MSRQQSTDQRVLVRKVAKMGQKINKQTNKTQRIRGYRPGAHTGPGILPILTSQMGRPHDSCALGRVLKGHPLGVGNNSPQNAHYTSPTLTSLKSQI